MNEFLAVTAVVFALKALLIPSYFSTDFEVHRNWLAITYNLPLSRWYLENTSQWTLDYPPFFAWFQWILAQIAHVYHPIITTISRSAVLDNKIILFQRISVIVCDLLLVYSAFQCATVVSSLKNLPKSSGLLYSKLATFILVIANAGLILVDNIHFQYNGFLTAFLLLSIKDVIRGNFLRGAFWYCVLVNFKHIYLYLAPAYVWYYFYHYCLSDKFFQTPSPWQWISFRRCLRLAFVIAAIFAASFGPFIYAGQMDRVLARLFPVRRGLTHAYWAPNFWSIYNFVDLLLYNIGKRIGAAMKLAPAYTSGLVQQYGHAVLPDIEPIHTVLLTAASMLLFCLVVKRGQFIELMSICAFSSYLFGWHVHEKAIILVTIPLGLLSIVDRRYAPVSIVVTTIGHYSITPLFFTQFETFIKFGAVFVYFLLQTYLLAKVHRSYIGVSPFLSRAEIIYLIGIIPIQIYCSIVHYLLGLDRRSPFLPLLLVSVYCSIGIIYGWFQLIYIYLQNNTSLINMIWMTIWTRRQNQMRRYVSTTISASSSFRVDGEFVIGGLDISTCKYDDETAQNACVSLALCRYPSMELIGSVERWVYITEPYIPGFLAFREANAMIDLVRSVQLENLPPPDVLLIDGNGILHPRRMGIACHVGVATGLPTIGVAKNLHLVDFLSDDSINYEKVLATHNQCPLKTLDGEQLGMAVKLSTSSKHPVFVSVGHNIDLDTSVDIVRRCSNGQHRVPEPLRHADSISRELVRRHFCD